MDLNHIATLYVAAISAMVVWQRFCQENGIPVGVVPRLKAIRGRKDAQVAFLGVIAATLPIFDFVLSNHNR